MKLILEMILEIHGTSLQVMLKVSTFVINNKSTIKIMVLFLVINFTSVVLGYKSILFNQYVYYTIIIIK